MSRGAFIVIDGTDGSGKATQFALLVEHLRRERSDIQTISFPQYGAKSAGPLEEYLEGTYGSALDVGPYRASILFAVDRYAASQKIQCALAANQIVVADRYVGSNMGHNGSKILDLEERKKFFEWNLELEHGIFQIPRPDINVILHVPAAIAQELIRKRDEKDGRKSGLSRDIHEEDLRHLEAAEQAYLHMASLYETYQLIECVESGILLSPEKIHERVWNLVNPFLT